LIPFGSVSGSGIDFIFVIIPHLIHADKIANVIRSDYLGHEENPSSVN
jgi:hypothetical protein